MDFDFFAGIEEDIPFDPLFEASLDDGVDDDDDQNGGEVVGDWELLETFNTVLDIEPVDKILLKLARQEVPIVMKRILNLLPNPPDPRRHNVRRSQEDFFKVWFNKCLLRPISEWLQIYLVESVTALEILHFIKIELIISFYQISPEVLFDAELTKFFRGGVKWEMTRSRYMQILSALSGVKRHSRDINTNPDGWKVVNSANRNMEKALECFRTEVASIAFVAMVTWFGLDDDLLRLRSFKMMEAGFSQINNPVKGLGAIHHGCVSLITCLYLAGHIQHSNESTLDCVTILQRALSGASIERNIFLRNVMAFWDRGYGGPDGVVNRESLKRGLAITGTSKRTMSFPFTFGSQAPGPKRKLISEKGTKSVYWARKKYNDGQVEKNQYALAYRNGTGRVVLMQTTLRENVD
jgi:hypothetical protein